MGHLGSGLPVFMGAAFAYVPTLTAVAGMGGTGAEEIGRAHV